MQDYSQNAIKTTSEAEIAYCKFIMPNDTGSTGSHQSGYYIHREAYRLIFNKAGVKGEILEKWVTLKWQDDFETRSRFIYYGQGTRNEYRLTNFGRGFPFLGDDSIGSLLILCKISDDYYHAYVLETEDEIENYLNFFSLPATEANGIVSDISKLPAGIEKRLLEYVTSLPAGFPSTKELSASAQEFFNKTAKIDKADIIDRPDLVLTGWVDTEYNMFKEVEKERYKKDYLVSSFRDVDSLVEAANTILNRRKSRAGKSLEHHLAKIFDVNELPYSAQGTTEGHKKPDFIIPSIELYHDANFSKNKLVFLAAKTTCKDRWRQVLNEAERTPNKHLFTLQQGVSQNQLREMKDEGLTLVVPEKHITMFPAENREDILTLKTFIEFSKAKIA
jgi:restriction endonuclease EcoRII-like protein